MGDVEYDLDSSGGLMDKLQALIAPPSSEQTSVKNGKESSKHPYYKRPGKGHNHDNCDACSEGGDLICCDKCPASFHLQCHDPPLEEKDIPQGLWLCHTCRRAEEAKSKNATNTVEEQGTDISTRKRLRNNKTPSTTTESTSPPPTPSAVKSTAKKQKSNPLEVLIQAASVLNPRQFELPKELTVPCPFPGTDKSEQTITTTKNGRRIMTRANGKVGRKPHELQPGGIVPLPARTCFECGRSCRVAPLLACDYCSLYFHLDCLDPPLTALPAGRWMCPNHVEHYIDSKLVTSVSATQRIRLWDRFTGPIDQDAIKTEFIRKAHCKNPPFRIKVKLGARNRIKVPGMVKYHYKNPVDLLPSLWGLKRARMLMKRDSYQFDVPDKIDLCSPDKVGDKNSKSVSQDSGIVEETVDKRPDKKPSEGDTWCVNGMRTNDNDDDTPLQIMSTLNQDLKLLDAVSTLNPDIDYELKQLDDRLVRVLAYQRLQQLSPADLQRASAHPPARKPLPSELLTPAEIERISRVFRSPTKNGAEPEVIPRRPPSPSEESAQVRARAVLYPVNATNMLSTVNTIETRLSDGTPMRYRSLTIGRGPTNHVDVDRYGSCNFVSSKHAVIFFDDAAQNYELINYSEYGTFVNNVLYTSDFTTKRSKPPSLVSDIVAKRKGSYMASRNKSQKPTCRCHKEGAPDVIEGWEGSAIISHGSLLKFGCVSFVFSITNQAGA